MYGLQRERDHGRDQGGGGAQPSDGVGGRADRAGRGRERGRQRGRAVRRGGGDAVRATPCQPESGVRGRGRAAGRVVSADRGRRGRGDAGGLGAATAGGRRRAHQPVAARVPARRHRTATDRHRPRRRRGAGRAAGLRDAAGGQGEHGGLRAGPNKTSIPRGCRCLHPDCLLDWDYRRSHLLPASYTPVNSKPYPVLGFKIHSDLIVRFTDEHASTCICKSIAQPLLTRRFGFFNSYDDKPEC